MKLRCKKVSVCKYRCKWLRVLSSRKRICVLGKCEAMHKIEITIVLYARKQFMRLRLMDLAPAYVGHGSLRAYVQLLGNCRNNAKTLRGVFLGRFCEQLHAKTDSQYWLAKSCYDFGKMVAVESLHRIGGGAYTGKDHVTGVADCVCIPCQRTVDAQTIQGIG